MHTHFTEQSDTNVRTIAASRSDYSLQSPLSPMPCRQFPVHIQTSNSPNHQTQSRSEKAVTLASPHYSITTFYSIFISFLFDPHPQPLLPFGTFNIYPAAATCYRVENLAIVEPYRTASCGSIASSLSRRTRRRDRLIIHRSETRYPPSRKVRNFVAVSKRCGLVIRINQPDSPHTTLS